MSKDRNYLANIVRPAAPFAIDGPFDLSNLNGKTILITGGASGLGEGFFRKWAENGATVIIGDINAGRGKALVEEVRRSSKNLNLHFLYCDVTKWQSQVDFFRTAAKLSPHGGIDAVVANAGIVADNPNFDSPPENLGTLEEPPPPANLKVVEVNLVGVMYTAHLAFHFLPQNPGSQATYSTSSGSQEIPKRDRHLLLIGSMAGICPFPGQIEYCTAKHGVTGLYRSLMMSAFTKGIRINLIMPYFSDTPLMSTVARVLLAGGPVGKVASVVDAATRLMASNVGGRALVVGPRAKVDEDWTIVPESSHNGTAVTTWEVYGKDFDDVDIFALRYVRLMNQITKLNGWGTWIYDTVTALLYPLQTLWRK